MQDASMQPEIVILRGAPGIGKSSLKKHLKIVFPRGAFIEIDDLREIHLNPEWFDDFIHTAMIKYGINMAENMLSDGIAFPIFISDTFSRGKVQAIANHIRRQFVIISFYCTAEVLRERLESRQVMYFRDFDAAFAINEEVTKSELSNEFKIDTTRLTTKQISERVSDIVQSKRRGK